MQENVNKQIWTIKLGIRLISHPGIMMALVHELKNSEKHYEKTSVKLVDFKVFNEEKFNDSQVINNE